MERIVTLNNFKKLNIASAISLAVLAFPAQAVVQIKDDVQLTDESYTEALQWTPGAAGNALELNNVTVDTDVKGSVGVIVPTADTNDISVTGSNITGKDKGLEVTKATGSKINIDKSTISGGNRGIVTTLTGGSSLNITDSTITAEGDRGISTTIKDNSSLNISGSTVSGNDRGILIWPLADSVLNIVNDSKIIGKNIGLDVTEATGAKINIDKSTISGESDKGISTTLNDNSSLNILNDSKITGKNIGLDVTEATGAEINIDKSTISSGGRGFSAEVLKGSTLNILNGSEITSEDIAVYIKSMDDSSSLTISDSLISGTKKGLEATLNSGSSLNISDSTLSGENLVMGIVANDSKVAMDNSTFTGASGINFSGHDSEIALSNSQASRLLLKGTDMLLDIGGSDIGSLGFSGHKATEPGNNIVNVDSSKLNQIDINFGGVNGGGNTINLNNSELTSPVDQRTPDFVVINIQDSLNNIINVKDSVIKGMILTSRYYQTEGDDFNNVINLDHSYFEGAVTTSAHNMNSTLNMGNNTTWVAKGESNAETLNITDSTVDIQDAIVGADNWHSENTNVLINSESQLNIGTGSGDMNMVIQSDGKELETLGKEIITVQNGEMDIQADDVDLGAYKYKLVNKDGKWVLERLESKEWTELENAGLPEGDTPFVLSNSANAALSSLAAAQASWNSQTGAVYERLNTRMEQDTGGVWGTYYGNEWAGEAGLSSTFNQKINGMAIGADKTLPLKDGQVTMGVAVMHDNSHLSGFDEKGSGGSMNSTAVHAYGRLAMNNGLFFKGTASAGSASSKLHANSSDGSVSKGDYKQNLFGLTGQAGYRYQVTPDVYVSPYAQMNGYTASATHFSLDNGMEVNSDRYWSARGELGVEAGVKTSVAGMAVTPHVMAAAGHEFVKNNDVHLNDIGAGFNNTVDGSGYKLGAGVEAQMTKNLSAGVNVNYSRSQDVEQRFGLSAGVRYDF